MRLKILANSLVCKRCLFSQHLEALNDRRIFAQQLPNPLTPDLKNELDSSNKWSSYCGIDPTGPLHLGHLYPLMALFNIRKCGYPIIALIGGATAKIGDPSDKVAERSVLDNDFLLKNSISIEKQLLKLDESFHHFASGKMDIVPEMLIVNNSTWYEGTSLIPFLSKYAREMHVNHMISLKYVKDRLEKGKVLNLAEFFYQFLQAYDFGELYQKHNCRVQIGGSDQWGNMVGGYEFVKSTKNVRNVCLTTPLLATGAGGVKMGKTNTSSRGNTQIWLDAKLTSPYKMYQFFLQRSDAESPQLLRSLTLCEMDEINEVTSSGRLRDPQVKLANEVVKFVHGDEGLNDAKIVTSLLHQRKPTLSGIDQVNIDKVLNSVQVIPFSSDDCIESVLERCDYFANSQSSIANFLSSGSVKVDGESVNSSDVLLSNVVSSSSASRYSVLSIGKHFRAVLDRQSNKD